MDIPAETTMFMSELVFALIRHFPHSSIEAEVKDYETPAIFIRLNLAKDASECEYSLENDIWKNIFFIELNKDFSLPTKPKICNVYGSSIRCFPQPELRKKGFLYGYLKTTFRTITATQKGIVKSLENWAIKSCTIILENADSINSVNKPLSPYKDFKSRLPLYDVRTKIVL